MAAVNRRLRRDDVIDPRYRDWKAAYKEDVQRTRHYNRVEFGTFMRIPPCGAKGAKPCGE